MAIDHLGRSTRRNKTELLVMSFLLILVNTLDLKLQKIPGFAELETDPAITPWIILIITCYLAWTFWTSSRDDYNSPSEPYFETKVKEVDEDWNNFIDGLSGSLYEMLSDTFFVKVPFKGSERQSLATRLKDAFRLFYNHHTYRGTGNDNSSFEELLANELETILRDYYRKESELTTEEDETQIGYLQDLITPYIETWMNFRVKKEEYEIDSEKAIKPSRHRRFNDLWFALIVWGIALLTMLSWYQDWIQPLLKASE